VKKKQIASQNDTNTWYDGHTLLCIDH